MIESEWVCDMSVSPYSFAPVIINVKEISILPWGLRYPDLLPVPINLLCVTAWLMWSLSLYLCQEGDALGAMEKVCRQLTYHLSPHSQWRRQGLLKRKPQSWWESRTDKQRGGLGFRQWGHMLPYFSQYNKSFFTAQFQRFYSCFTLTCLFYQGCHDYAKPGSNKKKEKRLHL